MDKLRELFRMQIELMDRYVDMNYIPQFPLDLTKKENVAVIRDCIFHIESELHEAYRELKNRPGRKTEMPIVEEKNYSKELMDILHLVIELMILSGFDSAKVFEYFKIVNENNHKRLDEGY